MGVAISLSGLASAIANEGGIGIISAAAIGMTEPDYMKKYRECNLRALSREIRRAKSLTNGVIGVNVMMALTDHEALILRAIEEKADLIIMGAGLPLKIPAVIADSGIRNDHTKLAVKVSSAKAARLIFQYWSNKYRLIPDAVVLEGPLAGGHLGFSREELTGAPVPLDQLVKETVEAVAPFEKQYGKDVPVIAAGGIYTGKDMFHMLRSGAAAVKMGTRFVTTLECDASPEFKQSFISCKPEDITLIDSPVGLPGRAIRNPFIDQISRGEKKPFRCGWNCLSTCDYKTAPYCIVEALYNAARGNMDKGFAFTGTNGHRATAIRPVAEVVREIVAEYEEQAVGYRLEAVGKRL
jgi:nitronate monooxygenase